MMTSGSYIETILDRIRFYTDEAETDAKYGNDYITRQIVMPAQIDVMARIHQTSEGRIILSFPITFVDGQLRYPLPPNVQSVIRMVERDDQDNILYDFKPRGLFHPEGEGWRIEGGPGAFTLVIGSTEPTVDGVEIWYVPSGDFCPVMGSPGTAVVTAANTDLTEVRLVKTSTLYGILDRRENAYAGAILRWIPDATNATSKLYPIASKMVESNVFYNPSASTALLLNLADSINVPATSAGYELVPPMGVVLAEAISVWGAIKIGTARQFSRSRMENLKLQYQMAIKTVCDQMTDLQTRNPTGFMPRTVDNKDGFGGSVWFPG